MMQGQITAPVLIAQRKTWTVHCINAPHALSYTAHQGRFAAAEVTGQFYDFTAVQFTTDLCAQL